MRSMLQVSVTDKSDTAACERRSAQFLTDGGSVAREKLRMRTDTVHFSSISYL